MRREANLWRGAIYRRFPVKPIVCCQPARSGEGHFLAMLPGLFLAVSLGLFSDSVVRNFVSWFMSWLFWLCDQGIVQDSDRSLQSSPAAQRTGKHYYIGTRSEVSGIRVYWSGKSEVKGKVAPLKVSLHLSLAKRLSNIRV